MSQAALAVLHGLLLLLPPANTIFKNMFLAIGVCSKKTQGHKRKYTATKADLVAKVVEETHRLKRMQHELVEPIPDGSDTNTSALLSAIQASLQHQSRGRLL